MRKTGQDVAGASDAAQGERSDEPPSWRSSRRARAAMTELEREAHAAASGDGVGGAARAGAGDDGATRRSALGSSVMLLVGGRCR